MPTPRIQYFDPVLTANRWAGDRLVAENLVSGSAHVNEKKWTADTETGRIGIPSGTLLGRRNDTTFLFEPVATGLQTNLGTTLTADVASGSTVITVDTVSGFADGDSIRVEDSTNLETVTIAANGINRTNSTITITAGLTNAYAAAVTTVSLATAVDQTEFFLLAFDIIDASARNDIPALYRQQRQVRINHLPGYASLPADVIAKIKELYQTVQAV